MKSLSKEELKGKLFIGEIVDNNDPLQEGRCRIKVFGLFDEEENIPVETIPWATPFNRKMFAGGEGGFADISVPKIGTYVRVQFAEGDVLSPEYTNIQIPNETVKDEISGSYLNSHVLAYDVDENMKIYYTPGKGLEIFLKDSHITINPDSSVTIEHSGTESIIELVGGNINIVSQNAVNVTSPQCIIESGDIQLGEGATESLIKGNLFATFFNSHVHPSAGAPPAVPLPPSFLSAISKTL